MQNTPSPIQDNLHGGKTHAISTSKSSEVFNTGSEKLPKQRNWMGIAAFLLLLAPVVGLASFATSSGSGDISHKISQQWDKLTGNDDSSGGDSTTKDDQDTDVVSFTESSDFKGIWILHNNGTITYKPHDASDNGHHAPLTQDDMNTLSNNGEYKVDHETTLTHAE